MFSYKTIVLTILLCMHQNFVLAMIEMVPAPHSSDKTTHETNSTTASKPSEVSSAIKFKSSENIELSDEAKNAAKRNEAQKFNALENDEYSNDENKNSLDLSNPELETVPLDLTDQTKVQISQNSELTIQDIDLVKQLVRQQIANKGFLQKNSLFSKIMLQIEDPTDINTSYALAKGFGEKNSRDVLQNMFNRLQSSKSEGWFTSNKLVNSTDFQQKFANDFIQKIIDGNLGVDANSFQSIYSLPVDTQRELVARFTDVPGKYSDIFNPASKLTKVEQLQLLASMHDDVMNVISGSKQFDKNGNLQSVNPTQAQTIFNTTYDADGNYTSSMKVLGKGSGNNRASIETKSVFDYKGNPTSRSFTDETGVTVRTNLRSGWIYGSYDNNNKPLNATDSSIFDNIWDLSKAAESFKANVRLAYQDSIAAITKENAVKLAKTTVKAGLSAGKQTGIYLLSSLLPYHIPLAAAALLLPVVKIITLLPAMQEPVYEVNPKTGQYALDANKNKIPVYETDQNGNIKTDPDYGFPIQKLKAKTYTGYQFTGHQWSDPSMALVAMKAIHLAVGDNGQLLGGVFTGGTPWLSGQGDRVFRQGTSISNALQLAQGKNTEVENLNETYIEAIPAVFQMIYAPLQFLFPQTLGSTILSKSDLNKVKNTNNSTGAVKKSNPIAPILNSPAVAA